MSFVKKVDSFRFPWENEVKRNDLARGPGALLPEKKTSSKLFSPLTLKGGVTLKNRIVVSPMCQYSSEDGFFNDWHLVHLGGFARGGAALVFTEATAVEDRGRISAFDTGLWKDEHIAPLKRIVSFIHANKALAGIQLAHAGRKASTPPLFFSETEIKRLWDPVGASPIPYDNKHHVPHELSVDEIKGIVKAFGKAAERAEQADFDVIELHGAHGYLISSFNSPLSNQRTDQYGGSFENRVRFCLEVVQEVKSKWNKPLFVRLSSSDWVEGGWTIEDTVKLSKLLKDLGVDLIDCSSGGVSPLQKINDFPGFQVPFAQRVKSEVGILSGAVGKITQAELAEEIISNNRADIVLLARVLLTDPNWPLHAAQKLRADIAWPLQYERAKSIASL